MDKKTILGLVLIFAIVVGFSYLNRPSEEEVARLEAQRDSIARVQAQEEAQRLAEEKARAAQDSAFRNPNMATADTLFRTEGVVKEVQLGNDKLLINFSTRGAYPRSVQVRGFRTYYGDSLLLFKENTKNKLELQFLSQHATIVTSEQLFLCNETTTTIAQKAGDTARIVFRLPSTQGDGYLE